MKPRDRAGGRVHHQHGQHHRRDHDLDILRHADRRDDGVDREHKIDRDDLRHDQREGRIGLGGRTVRLVGLDLGMDLVRRLRDQEQAAGNQDDVVPGERT